VLTVAALSYLLMHSVAASDDYSTAICLLLLDTVCTLTAFLSLCTLKNMLYVI
jgi:hypothetical protein